MITRPCYCNRDDVMRAPDLKSGVLEIEQIDRALESAADDIEGKTHRLFYPWDGTKYFDWPNYQYAAPWRYHFERHECVALTSLQSPGGSAIPLFQVFLEPVNNADRDFPYKRIELDRSTVAAWGIGPTPQHSIWAAGTWGFTATAVQVATLAANIGAGDTSITVTNGARVGAGDVAVIGYGRGSAPYPQYPGTAGAVQPYLGERLLVTDKTATTTGLTQSGAGCSTASSADDQLATTGTGALNPGEIIQLDSERMLVESVTAGIATVQRAWDGTILDTHTNATVYALRQLSVQRGALGTAAASATAGTSVHRHRPPSFIRDLSLALCVDQMLQETSGYSRTVGDGQALLRASGTALADKWARVNRALGRQQRIGAI